REFPALPVEAFRREKVTTFEGERAVFDFETSGTTDSVKGRHYLKNGRCYEKSLELGFRQFMPDLSGHRWLSLVPAWKDRPHSSLAYMLKHLAGSIPEAGGMEVLTDAEYVIDFPAVAKVLHESVERSERVALFGTSFALAQAAEFMWQEGSVLRLEEGSVIFDTGGYKGRHRELSAEEFLELLERSWGVERMGVWNEYGMTELSSQGYARLDQGLHHFPAWVRVRLVNPATGRDAEAGERGLIHVYDLANVHSVMAVGTQDVGVWEEGGIRVLGRLKSAPERGCSLPFERVGEAS
ncbi:MAG: hypothetical protein HC904_13960, partial [Blastochloris sp.]|nr:hypothetical protein [Blastochloris sp.]